MLLVCDIQERFRPLIYRFPAVVRSAGVLLRVAALLNIQVFATEQNPDKLGATVGELSPLIKTPILAKMAFSMLGGPQSTLPPILTTSGGGDGASRHVIICGIETHVCIAQTVRDLLEQRIAVSVVVDGVSSQRAGDRTIALAAMSKAGAVLTTTEAVLFEMMATADHPRFKDVQRIAIELATAYNKENAVVLDHL